MRKMLCLLFLTFTTSQISVTAFAQTPAQNKGSGCRIVDMVVKGGHEIDYVDGTRVPGNLVDIDYLRVQEKASPRPCLLLFITTASKIRDVEGMRVVAGKMGYAEFHAYLYEPSRDSAREITYGPDANLDQLRSGPHGTIPWPDTPKR
jgi:hypothetical protein